MGNVERIMAVVSRQTFVYTFVADYLVWMSLFLVLWMSFCPFLSLRRGPARALNWFSRKIRLTQRFKFTSVLMVLAFIAAATEYLSMSSKQNNYKECKAKGMAQDNCNALLGQKWRAERNFWLMSFNFFAWFIVDILSKQTQQEEYYQEFLALKNSEFPDQFDAFVDGRAQAKTREHTD